MTSDSDLIYCGQLAKNSYFNMIGKHDMVTLNVDKAIFMDALCTQCWIFTTMGGDEPHMYVTFRGTDSLSDLLTNINIVLVPLNKNASNGKVHSGYLTFERISQIMVTPEVDKFLTKHPNGRLTFVGHSMGGAMAVLYGMELAQSCPSAKDNIRCVTFASPPIGDMQFCDALKTFVPSITRVVHDHDVIPNLRAPFYKHTHGKLLLRHSEYDHDHHITTSSKKHNNRNNNNRTTHNRYNHNNHNHNSNNSMRHTHMRLLRYHSIDNYIDTLVRMRNSYKNIVRLS